LLWRTGWSLSFILHGPYASEKASESQVKAIHKAIKDEDSLIGLGFDETGIPEVWTYSSGFFEGK
jgi:predicted TIM-barrel enzyme